MLCKSKAFKVLPDASGGKQSANIINKGMGLANKISIFVIETFQVSWQNDTQYFPRAAS